MRHTLLANLTAVFVVVFGATACQGGPDESEAWNAAFQRRDGFGWSGGDGAYSVPLPNSRTLWLFGDSYLSDVSATGRTDGTIRFGSTIAIQDNLPGLFPPTAADLYFDWGAPNSNGWLPVGWDVLVDDGMVPESIAKARAAKLGLLAWPLHGMTVGSDLVLFTLPVSPFKCDDCEGPAIKVHGSVASIVRGVDRPYSEWGFVREQGWVGGQQPTQRFVSHSRATPALEDPTWTFWGNFVMADPSGVRAVFVYGHQRDGDVNSTVVARVPNVATADDLLAFDNWTFWAGTSWASQPEDAVPIAGNSATETSVLPVPPEHGGGFAMVESNNPYSIEIKVSLAANPWGPFVEKYVLSLADCPIEGFDPARDVTYAAKAHVEFSTDTSLLVSLVMMPKPGTTSAMVVADPRQYAPRFIELPWTEVMDNAHSSSDRCGE
jgi:hypothetical protein